MQHRLCYSLGSDKNNVVVTVRAGLESGSKRRVLICSDSLLFCVEWWTIRESVYEKYVWLHEEHV